MKILYASSEVVPYAKTGGLADVSGALPKSIEKLGNDIRIVMPKYKMIDEKKYKLKKIAWSIKVLMDNNIEFADVYEAYLPDTKIVVYFIANDKYFARDGLYQEKGNDYPDNCERFSFFCKATCEFIKQINWIPDVLHCNDWQTALLIPLFKLKYDFKATVSVYSIHNMGYLGLFPKEKIFVTGFSWEMFAYDKLEFWDKLCFAKAGLVFADAINTVSETYAKEIQTPEFGCGLHGLLRLRAEVVSGILNGIDFDLWNPETDEVIVKKYGVDSINLKYENKKALQKQNKLSVRATIPLIGMISRLTDQKGFDILAKALEKIMNLKCQLIILGTGDPKYHELLNKMNKKFPKQIGIKLGFDAALAELIYAGSDMFLMPSLYEPCGLGQLISFKYGTVPIVRKIGGLADTVHDFDPKTGRGDGFVFEEYNSGSLLNAIERAIEIYKNKRQWTTIIEKIMCYDYSWEVSARKYVELYRKTLEKQNK